MNNQIRSTKLNHARATLEHPPQIRSGSSTKGNAMNQLAGSVLRIFVMGFALALASCGQTPQPLAVSVAQSPDTSVAQPPTASSDLTLQPASVVQDGLVGYWAFDNTNLDYSGQSNHAALQSAATFTTNHAPTPFANAAALALRPGSYATAATHGRYELSLSIAAWVHMNPSPSAITKLVSLDRSVSLQFAKVSGSSGFQFQVYTAGPEMATLLAPVKSVAPWMHVVATRQGSDLRLYVNGQPVARMTGPTSGTASAGVTFGGPRDGLDGALDDVRIYDHALTEAEVAVLGYSCGGVTEIPQAECHALASVFFQTGGPAWTNRNGWEQTPTPCAWYGVTCAGGHVVALDLSRNNLVGNLAPELGDLLELGTLRLNGNKLIGPIPPAFGRLGKLRGLYLSENWLETIPAELGQLAQLRDLSLQNNRLTGNVPASVARLTGLLHLDLGYNVLFATDPAALGLLNAKQGNWAATQTVAPANLSTCILSSASLELNWTPIAYTADGGYYQITVFDRSHNRYLPTVRTGDKKRSSLVVSGLPVGALISFQIATITPPHGLQQNNLQSPNSARLEFNPNGNQPPVVRPDLYSGDGAFTVDAQSGVLANDFDPEGVHLRATKQSDPMHGTVRFNPDGSFSYKPKAGYLGPDHFSYSASDGTNEITTTVLLEVHGLNRAPTATLDQYDTQKNTPLNVDARHGVLANDTDPDTSKPTADLMATTAHGTLTFNLDGSFSYAPQAGFSGNDTFTYRASDGVDYTKVTRVIIQVGRPNSPPVAVNDAYTTTRDTPLTVDAARGILANDNDPDGNPLRIASISTSVAGSKLALNPDGSFSLTPPAGFV